MKVTQFCTHSYQFNAHCTVYTKHNIKMRNEKHRGAKQRKPHVVYYYRVFGIFPQKSSFKTSI